MFDTETVETVETVAPANAGKFAISTDIPIPDSKGKGSKYPWNDLPVKGSFEIPGAKVKVMQTTCTKKSKDLSKKFIAREWDCEGGVKGVRIWRKE